MATFNSVTQIYRGQLQPLLVVTTTLMLLVAASSVRASESGTTTVFRAVGADGVVSFNDLGQGEPIAIASARETTAEEREAQRVQHTDILNLAERLAQERRARTTHRAELASIQTQTRIDTPRTPAVNDSYQGARFFAPRFGHRARFGFSNSRRFSNTQFGNQRFGDQGFGNQGFSRRLDSRGFGKQRQFGNNRSLRSSNRRATVPTRTRVSRVPR